MALCNFEISLVLASFRHVLDNVKKKKKNVFKFSTTITTNCDEEEKTRSGRRHIDGLFVCSKSSEMLGGKKPVKPIVIDNRNNNYTMLSLHGGESACARRCHCGVI